MNNSFLLLINKVLANNQGSLLLLKKYRGQTFSINIIGLINFRAIICNDGLLDEIDQNMPTSINMSIPLSIASEVIRNNKMAMLQKISFRGNKHDGIEILKIISNLQISEAILQTDSVWLALLIKTLNKFIGTLKNTLLLFGKNASQSISEYLQYESKDIVNQYEIEQFCDAVDTLRERTDTLIKRINVLNNKL